MIHEWPWREVCCNMQAYEPTTSFNAPCSSHEPGETIGDSIADDSQAAPERALAMDMDRVLATLTPREAQILRARYGLDDNKLKTLEEVGALFNVRMTTSTCPSDESLRRLVSFGHTE